MAVAELIIFPETGDKTTDWDHFGHEKLPENFAKIGYRNGRGECIMSFGGLCLRG